MISYFFFIWFKICSYNFFGFIIYSIYNISKISSFYR
nr:MAG TPA: hypothetical protein [Caudoviricetes sp.]